MSWRTVIIKDYDKVSLSNNNLIISSTKDPCKNNHSIPIEDINCVLLENNYTLFSTQLVNQLVNNNVAIIVANENHDPNVVMLPLAAHCMPLVNLQLQFNASIEFKQDLWTKIVKNKIKNQILILQELDMDANVINQCNELANSIKYNDANNREGLVAKMYFRCLYGSSFLRFHDDTINQALNYGYKIISSCLSRTLATYGLNLYVGFHHIGPQNPFNLTYDLIEPYRPIVDRWVYLNWEVLDPLDGLNYATRLSLIKLLNAPVKIDNKKMSLNSSFHWYIKSLISALKTNNVNKFVSVKIIDPNTEINNNEDASDDTE